MSSFSLGFSSRLSLSTFGGVMLRHPLTIAAAGDITYPIFVFEIPADSFSDAALKRLQWMPVQFALDLAAVHRVAAAVGRGAVFQTAEFSWLYGRRRRWALSPAL